MNTVVTDPVTIAYHELRSPLALMATMARVAAADCRDEELRARCESIVNAAERMLRTAGHLMVVAETSKDVNARLFDAQAVVGTIVADYREMGVSIEVSDETRQPILLEASPATFEALLCSLLGNATDHGGTGDIALRVRVDQGTCQVRIENRISRSLKHRGIGLGTYIGGKLAAELAGSLFTERTDTTYAVTFCVPLASEMLLAV